jgi:hypothetical protein
MPCLTAHACDVWLVIADWITHELVNATVWSPVASAARATSAAAGVLRDLRAILAALPSAPSFSKLSLTAESRSPVRRRGEVHTLWHGIVPSGLVPHHNAQERVGLHVLVGAACTYDSAQ